jgi:hypothetical protein
MKLILVVLLLAGCVSSPKLTREEMLALAGPPPTRPSMNVEVYLEGTLKDPDSVKNLNIEPSYPCRWTKSPFTPTRYGHCVRATYNAKNSYGGYVGTRAVTLYLINDSIEYWDDR